MFPPTRGALRDARTADQHRAERESARRRRRHKIGAWVIVSILIVIVAGPAVWGYRLNERAMAQVVPIMGRSAVAVTTLVIFTDDLPHHYGPTPMSCVKDIAWGPVAFLQAAARPRQAAPEPELRPQHHDPRMCPPHNRLGVRRPPACERPRRAARAEACAGPPAFPDVVRLVAASG